MAERPEDLNLPIAVITRIIKEALPDGVNVSKDARLAISKAASVFVLYATSCANNIAMEHKRKTISGNDVVESMKDMEYERFVDPLKECLEIFKRELKGKKEASEQRKKAKEQDSTEKTEENGNEEVEEDGEEEESEDGEEEGEDGEEEEGEEDAEG